MSRIIGSGTFGNVVHATVIPDDRSMLTGALKLAPACPAAAAALSRELEAYARLADQRDIPRVLAWAPTTDGTAVAAILFDRLPGTLADDIALRLRVLATTNPERPHPTRDAPLYSPHEYWPVIHKLAALLAIAHGRGIIHADIKPANILLDTDRNPKLADWGIFLDAPLDGAPPPTVRGPHGTEGYCLPALAAGAETVEVNFSIDTQALALTVVEMLLGMLPEHAREVAGQGELGEYLPPHDGELRSLVLGTLREEAGERPPVAAWLRGRRRGCCVPEPRIWGAVEVPLAQGQLPNTTAARTESGRAHSAAAAALGESAPGRESETSSSPWCESGGGASAPLLCSETHLSASRGDFLSSATAEFAGLTTPGAHSHRHAAGGLSAAASSRRSSVFLPSPEITDWTPAASSAPARSLTHSRVTSGYGGGEGGHRRSSAGAATPVHVTTNPCFAEGLCGGGVAAAAGFVPSPEVRGGSLPLGLTRSLGSMQMYMAEGASPRGGGGTPVYDDSGALTALAVSPAAGVSSVVFTGTLGTLDSQFALTGDLAIAGAGDAPLAAAPFYDSIAEEVEWCAASPGGAGAVGCLESGCGDGAQAGGEGEGVWVRGCDIPSAVAAGCDAGGGEGGCGGDGACVGVGKGGEGGGGKVGGGLAWIQVSAGGGEHEEAAVHAGSGYAQRRQGARGGVWKLPFSCIAPPKGVQ